MTYETVELHSKSFEIAFVVLGSLLIPSLYVYYLDLHNHFVEPRWQTLVLTFALGALLAAPLAAVLEAFLPAGTGAPGPAFVTGLIEEFAKGLVVLIILRRSYKRLRFQMDGIIIGAAAGMGFAAIEDMLYGVTAFKHGLTVVIATVWTRQILAAFGHGTWTAIVGGAIWKARGSGIPRVTISVLGAYLVAAVLHALWDWEPLGGDAALFWFLLVGVAGLLILRVMVREALSEEEAYIKRLPSDAQAPAQ